MLTTYIYIYKSHWVPIKAWCRVLYCDRISNKYTVKKESALGRSVRVNFFFWNTGRKGFTITKFINQQESKREGVKRKTFSRRYGAWARWNIWKNSISSYKHSLQSTLKLQQDPAVECTYCHILALIYEDPNQIHQTDSDVRTKNPHKDYVTICYCQCTDH